MGSSLFPTFKERDFLMHWISAAGNLGCGGVPDLAARL